MPHQIQRSLTVTETGGDDAPAAPAPVPELKENTMLGLRGILAQWSQAGAVGVIIVVATIGAHFYRVDMLERMQTDRDDRNQQRLDERERLKDRDDRLRDRDEVQNRILQALSLAIDGQRVATTELKTEIRAANVEHTTAAKATTAAVEELTRTIKDKK